MPSTARSAPPVFTITALALEFDITARAIPFHADLGLLKPGRAGRNFVFNPRGRTRLKLTLHGDRLGQITQHKQRCCNALGAAKATAAEKPEANPHRANGAPRAQRRQGDTA